MPRESVMKLIIATSESPCGFTKPSLGLMRSKNHQDRWFPHSTFQRRCRWPWDLCRTHTHAQLSLLESVSAPSYCVCGLMNQNYVWSKKWSVFLAFSLSLLSDTHIIPFVTHVNLTPVLCSLILCSIHHIGSRILSPDPLKGKYFPFKVGQIDDKNILELAN